MGDVLIEAQGLLLMRVQWSQTISHCFLVWVFYLERQQELMLLRLRIMKGDNTTCGGTTKVDS